VEVMIRYHKNALKKNKKSNKFVFETFTHRPL